MSAFFVSSPSIKNVRPSFVSVTSMALSGATLLETELGICTANTSGGFCFVASIKNDNKRNATSHIAVISTAVLFLGILTFGIYRNFKSYLFQFFSKTSFCMYLHDLYCSSTFIRCSCCVFPYNYLYKDAND